MRDQLSQQVEVVDLVRNGSLGFGGRVDVALGKETRLDDAD